MPTNINIRYPFKDSPKGYFLDLTTNDDDAIKSDLMHLLLTNKGERLYNPNFGTNLLKFIFEPNDGLSMSSIESEIKETVKLYFPSLTINEILVEPSIDNDYSVTVKIKYTKTDNVFETTDILIINI